MTANMSHYIQRTAGSTATGGEAATTERAGDLAHVVIIETTFDIVRRNFRVRAKSNSSANLSRVTDNLVD